MISMQHWVNNLDKSTKFALGIFYYYAFLHSIFLAIQIFTNSPAIKLPTRKSQIVKSTVLN